MNVKVYTNQINQSLSKYKKKIHYAFLFGSILKKPLPTSDIDLLLGANLNSFEKIDLAMELELILKRKIDVVLTKESSCELVLKAFSKGLPVMINDKKRLKTDYFKNIQLYDNKTTLRNLRISRVKRKYGYAG